MKLEGMMKSEIACCPGRSEHVIWAMKEGLQFSVELMRSLPECSLPAQQLGAAGEGRKIAVTCWEDTCVIRKYRTPDHVFFSY